MYRMFIKYCVFFRIIQNIPDSIFPQCQCVYTYQAGRKPALQQNWQSSEISQHFKEKTQYLMNTLYVVGNEQLKENNHFLNYEIDHANDYIW